MRYFLLLLLLFPSFSFGQEIDRKNFLMMGFTTSAAVREGHESGERVREDPFDRKNQLVVRAEPARPEPPKVARSTTRSEPFYDEATKRWWQWIYADDPDYYRIASYTSTTGTPSVPSYVSSTPAPTLLYQPVSYSPMYSYGPSAGYSNVGFSYGGASFGGFSGSMGGGACAGGG
jgi:hypothetical protein